MCSYFEALSTGFQTNMTAFPEYSLETATPYIQEHSWFYMPVSVHKILIYGSEIISTAILPTGLLSEKVQESRNKDLKHFRWSHTRKNSRENTIGHLFHLRLASSDPLIKKSMAPTKKSRLHFSSVSFSNKFTSGSWKRILQQFIRWLLQSYWRWL